MSESKPTTSYITADEIMRTVARDGNSYTDDYATWDQVQ
jgi:hypothetical protein